MKRSGWCRAVAPAVGLLLGAGFLPGSASANTAVRHGEHTSVQTFGAYEVVYAAAAVQATPGPDGALVGVCSFQRTDPTKREWMTPDCWFEYADTGVRFGGLDGTYSSNGGTAAADGEYRPSTDRPLQLCIRVHMSNDNGVLLATGPTVCTPL